MHQPQPLSSAVCVPARVSGARASKRADVPFQLRVLQAALRPDRIDNRLPYTAQIAQQLREAIMTLQLLPGTPISESAIAQVLGLSRTPVREALKELSDENFVDIFPQAGTVVSLIRLSLIDHGTFVRRALECENLIELVDAVTDAGRAEIAAILAAQHSAIERKDNAEFFLQDEALHRVFFALNGRMDAWHMVLRLRRHVDRARRLLIIEDHTRCALAYAEHQAIVQALLTRDQTALRLAMQTHVNRLPSVLQRHLNLVHPSWVSH